MSTRPGILFAFSFLLYSTTCLYAVSPSFVGIDFLDEGLPFARALGVSGDGSTVVGFQAWSPTGSNEFSTQAIIWTAHEGVQLLGQLPTGESSAAATATNQDGSVVVGTLGNDFFFSKSSGAEAFRWTSTEGYEGLGQLSDGVNFSFATSVSDDGSVIGGYADILRTGASEAREDGFRWTRDTGLTELSQFSPLINPRRIYGMNEDGTTLVGSFTFGSSGPVYSYILPPSGNERYLQGFTPVSEFSRATAMSDDGQVMVGFGDYTLDRRTVTGDPLAYRWTESEGFQSLGFLEGDSASEALDISGDGETIVGRSGLSAFIWTADSGMRALSDALIDEGIDLQGWSLQVATGVSDDGTVISGYGMNPQGQVAGWVASIPEPGQLMGMSLLAALSLRSRSRFAYASIEVALRKNHLAD
ncbi:hypothetical protein [Mucisphaera sp.]|uniref:hypothetical protein n=1 Tax=Mucisphaera sp. TaxID=2913024 RepID=UPI003D10A976